MNLSEIRKKAQQERQDGGEQQSVPPRPTTVEQSEQAPQSPPMAAAKPLTVTHAEAVGHVREQMPMRPGDLLPQTFDPVALILAGRHDALEQEETESSENDGTVLDQAEYEECLCFRVATERYAISIMEIKEITKPREMTEVPRAPSFVSGVISLRGVIVPIFDLGQRLHLPVVQPTGRARIIVVKKGEDLFGILVDEVIQVVKVPAASIELPPAVLEGIDREFVRGIGRYDGNMLIMLHLGKILDLSLT
jgi:purine-binding chemotaxis protein CheW